MDVRIHRSQFPEVVAGELANCLRERRLKHKFLYESNRQANLWLAIHRRFAPYEIDQNGRNVYAKIFSRFGKRFADRRVDVISLGCGSGNKDADLLQVLTGAGCSASYLACDVSPGLTIEASRTVGERLPELPTSRFVCDLLAEPDPFGALSAGIGRDRLVLGFGLLPNFTPDEFLPRMRKLLDEGGRLLISANLCPDDSLESIVPQYDNDETREWLLGFVRDLGVDVDGDQIRFSIGNDRRFKGLRRIEANISFPERQVVVLGGERIGFESGASMRLFFSCRYTVTQLEEVASAFGMRIADREIAAGGEEGVFEIAVCREVS